MSLMWFYDDYGELEDYQAFRKEALPLEKEYLDLRKVLHEAEAALRQDPENEHLQAKVAYLKKRLRGLEQKAPWLAGDRPMEYDLWGSPH